SYYSSIDEGAARLSQSALDLLKGGDALGFFRACGTHYLRSISRRSQFLTLFSYTSAETQADKGFERRIEQAVRQFSPGGADDKDEKAASADFGQDARTRELKIVTKGIGLVAEKNGQLIPFDLPS